MGPLFLLGGHKSLPSALAIGMTEQTDLEVCTETSNLLSSQSLVMGFRSFVSCSVANIKFLLKFLKDSSVPVKLQSVPSSTSLSTTVLSGDPFLPHLKESENKQVFSLRLSQCHSGS